MAAHHLGLAQVDLGQVVQQMLRLTQMRSGARHADCSPRPTLSQERHDVMTKIIARMISALITWILDPGQPVSLRISMELGTVHIQQWPNQPAATQCPGSRHTGQPAHTGAAQQAKEQGFGLVISMLGSEQHFGRVQTLTEHRIARLPGRTLEARARRNLHLRDL